MKSKLDYDPEVFFITEDHLILRFRSKKECSMVLNDGPRFVVGQLLAMKAWEAKFVPGHRAMEKAIVWLRSRGSNWSIGYQR